MCSGLWATFADGRPLPHRTRLQGAAQMGSGRASRTAMVCQATSEMSSRREVRTEGVPSVRPAATVLLFAFRSFWRESGCLDRATFTRSAVHAVGLIGCASGGVRTAVNRPGSRMLDANGSHWSHCATTLCRSWPPMVRVLTAHLICLQPS